MLGMLFREHPEYGSRDRRLMGDAIFAVLRWWGWLYDLAGLPEPGIISPEALSSPGCARLLAAAALLEREFSVPVAQVWADVLGIDWHQACRDAETGDILARGRDVRRAVAADARVASRPLALRHLAPAAWWDLIDSPRPIEELAEWFQRRPPTWLRVQKGTVQAARERLADEGLTTAPNARLVDALEVTAGRASFPSLASYREGLFEVQDLDSQAIGHVCAPTPGQRWWDACAGGGGKSLHLARLMSGKGTVVASDIRDYKLVDVRKRAVRADLHNIVCRPWDGRPLDPRKAAYDGVLIDAPCTCSGTWRRNPDARWRTTRADIDELPRSQAAILDAACNAVKPGGVLVYATCSVFTRENRDVVAGFLARHADFRLDPFASPLTQEPTDGCLQLWPWDGDADAMFVARMRRA